MLPLVQLNVSIMLSYIFKILTYWDALLWWDRNSFLLRAFYWAISHSMIVLYSRDIEGVGAIRDII